MFDARVYQDRRASLMGELAQRGVRGGLVVFPGNKEAPVNYADNTYRFRQDSSFMYFFGLQEPGMAGAIDVASGRATLYAEDQGEDDMVWTGPRPSAEDLRAACGAEAVAAPGALPAHLADRQARQPGSVLYLPPYRADTRADLAAWLGLAYGAVDSGASMPLIKSVIALREIKEDRELTHIEAAVNTTIAMHRAVLGYAREGMSEAQVMATAYREALAGGGLPSFPPIATTNGAILHCHGYGGQLKAGGLFLLDCGAEDAEGYAGDLTSTFPISGRYDDRQKAIYEIVLKAGRDAAATLAVGNPFREAHVAAARAIAGGLKDLGIMKGDTEAAVAAGAHALFFPHGVGHQMGLDVHDMEALGEINVGYDGEAKSTQFGLKSLRLAKPLKAGMVFTIEPGIYFIAGLIPRWKAEGKFTDFINYAEAERWIGVGGFRNEEDWAMTATGPRLLGQPFDKSVAAMEGYRRA